MCVLNVSHMDLILNNSPYRLIDRLWSTDTHRNFHENMTYKSWFVSFVPYWSQFTVELAACMKMAHSYIPQTYPKMHGSIAQDLKAGIALTWRILNAWQGQVEQLRIWHGMWLRVTLYKVDWESSWMSLNTTFNQGTFQVLRLDQEEPLQAWNG